MANFRKRRRLFKIYETMIKLIRNRQTDKQTNRQTDRQAAKQTNKQPNRQTDKQPNRQAGRKVVK